MPTIPKAVKKSYSGFVRMIKVSPTNLVILRTRRSGSSIYADNIIHRYKSDLSTFEFFKKLVEDNVIKVGTNEYKCLHSLWKGCIIKIHA